MRDSLKSAAALWAESGLTGDYEVWSFGDAPDELAFLVLSGKKTATSSAYECFLQEGEKLPQAGEYSVITDSSDEAVCIIRDTRVRILPYKDIDEEQAFKEGEGDRSLAYYRSVHAPFFEQELALCKKDFSEDSLIVLEEFELVWPKLYMKALNVKDAEAEHKAFNRIPTENGFENPFYGQDLETFRNVTIPQLINESEGINLKKDHVPQTCFMLWREQEIVGIFKVRHCLNEITRTGSGHIGYAIAPAYRNRGYARYGLELAIKELKKMPDFPEKEVYLSCYKSNPASLKVMLKNGAYITHEDQWRYFARIPVRMKEKEDGIQRDRS